MSLTDLFRRKRKLELEIVSKGENLVEVKMYHNGKEVGTPVKVYTFSEEFVKAINSYQ